MRFGYKGLRFVECRGQDSGSRLKRVSESEFRMLRTPAGTVFLSLGKPQTPSFLDASTYMTFQCCSLRVFGCIRSRV